MRMRSGKVLLNWLWQASGQVDQELQGERFFCPIAAQRSMSFIDEGAYVDQPFHQIYVATYVKHDPTVIAKTK